MPNCPNVLETGTCTDHDCEFEHNILVCEPCNFIALDDEDYDDHIATKTHLNRIAGMNLLLYCTICKTNMSTSNWEQHIEGKRHIRHAERRRISAYIEPQLATSVPGQIFCEICMRVVRRWDRHLESQGHKKKEAFISYKAALDEAEKDKNGIIIDGNLDFGIVDPSEWREGSSVTVTLKTITPNLRVRLEDWKLVSTRGSSVTSSGLIIMERFTVTFHDGNRVINPRQSVKLIITLNQQYIGRYEDRLEFVLKDIQLRKRFFISRSVRAIVGNREDHEKLKPKAPYVPKKWTKRSVKPPSLQAIPYIGTLPRAHIPRTISAILAEGSVKEITSHIKRTFLPAVLDSDTFGRHFKALLWVEETRMEQDLERYDMHNVKFLRDRGSYYVEVPGLAEKRPSVLVGDRILVQQDGAREGDWYEGFVHFVRKMAVGLRFHHSFKGWTPEQRYHVRFKLNRIPLRRQHQAMDMVFQEDRVLFPLNTHITYRSRRGVALRYFNENIASNIQQKQAVTSIVRLLAGSPPFVVFGPFGTGKTSTIVEAMLQVLFSNPEARILACAPSNSAADLLVTKLSSTLSKETLFRFNAPSRPRTAVPDDVLEYSYVRDDPRFEIWPFGVPMTRIKRFRVVASTCVSASFAAGIGMPRGHFTHIFIDEAGQATEPETLLSVKTIADPNTNIILAGDPKQLGPIIRSPIARELGLQLSYLERLMNRDAYDTEEYLGDTVVKLLQNYRSHPAILEFPNEEFYGGELEVCAEPKKRDRYIGCPVLPNPNFPIVFHTVHGQDDREASSPSFFNIDETSQIKHYVDLLRFSRQFRTNDHDIGIITPYHAQVLKIRTRLKGYADEIKVGSIEEFQGQERPVIMISTVRSSKEPIEYDLRHTLGFVANPRRFNVAITRTQALLIIVGDPQVLSIDPMWRSFLNYIYNNRGWKGPSPDWDTTAPVDAEGKYDEIIRERANLDMNDFTRRMEQMTLDGIDEDDGGGVDQPWREVE
ncbi:hypothetical protein AMATHDRAFT_50790 [Amanita thiersii Skay4041]|uniref:RNA helicase n=1 Tax=Amanita thiersii Skay4041 TaxID=703135 RepID=A0A2A9NG90_9AGAR|nr:hypothetical protein AMATHDRAFT_50790 [Amanita thiersii Skay4041]